MFLPPTPTPAFLRLGSPRVSHGHCTEGEVVPERAEICSRTRATKEASRRLGFLPLAAPVLPARPLQAFSCPGDDLCVPKKGENKPRKAFWMKQPCELG